MARRQLPLPDGIAPTRRAPPPLPSGDDDVPPPPLPSRPTQGRPSPAAPPSVPTSRIPAKPAIARKVQQSNNDYDIEDDSFDSDSSTESYEDMTNQEKLEEPQRREPILPARGYKEHRPPPPPPAKFKPPTPQQEELYDDGEGGEIYDEAEMGKAEESEDDGETYDDMDVEEEFVQESYDEFQGVAEDMYEVEEPQEEYSEFEVGEAVSEEVYQVADDGAPSLPPPPAAPALPPPRPKQSRDAVPPPPRSVEKKAPAKIAGPGGMPAIAMGDIQNIKDRLKKVNVAKAPPPKAEPKTYTDHTELKSKFDFFKQKEKEDDSDTGDQENIRKFNLRPTQNKPIATNSATENTNVPLKPSQFKKPPSIPMKPSRDSEENTGTTNFLGQVKLKPTPRTFNNNSASSLSVNKEETTNQSKSGPSWNPPIFKRDVSPSGGIPSNHVPPKPSRAPFSNQSPVKPTPVPRPGDKKSFLHAYIGGHPEIANQRIPTMMVNASEEVNDDDDDGEIYDDALSFEDPLVREIWYFGEMDRVVGNNKLKKLAMNGAFLLRKSSKGGNNQPYTLMVMYNSHIYNLKIRERNDGRMAIGEEKPDEMSFKSVVDLIKHHQSNDVILVHKDGKEEHTMLLRAPPK